MKKRPTGFAFYRELLRGIKRQIREVQGPEDAAVRRYYRSYAAILERSHPAPCQERDFLERAASARLVLVGDFHTLDQAQWQYLKVLKALRRQGALPALALEMVQAHHDKKLQEYLAGECPDEGSFLEKTGFFEHWGFDFAHYRPLLEWARSLGVPAHAINVEGGLAARDRFMAERLAHLCGVYPDRVVVVLVGDLHLAPRHLPAQLAKRSFAPVLLYQNSESVTMRRLRAGAEPSGWFRLDEDRFLVNNTYPWVKMQTYLSWLEHGGEALSSLQGFTKAAAAGGRTDDDGDDDLTDGSVDLTETVHEYIRVLKDLFDLRLRADDNFQVFTMRALDFLDDAYYRREPGKTYAKIIREGRALFLKRGNIIYIPILDVNRTVQEAAHYLMGADLDAGPGGGSFFRRLHYFASGFVASKLINPLRHYRTREAMRKALEDQARYKTAKERAYGERLLGVLRTTLAFFDAVEGYGGCSRMPQIELDRFVAADRPTLFALSEQIGFQLGEGLYRSYDAGELSGEDLKHYIFAQGDPFHFCRTYNRHLAEVVEGQGPT